MSAPALRQRAAQGPANGSVQRSERSIQARATASRNKTPLGTDSRATNGVLQTFLNPLALALPKRLAIGLHEMPELGSLLDLLFKEAFDDQPGKQQALNRLFELVLIGLLRYSLSKGATEAGLLRGLGHPQVGKVLASVHAAPELNWTLTRMANLSGMSRSSFASTFKAVVGLTPGDYLMHWRVAIAQSLLLKQVPLKSIAERVGYASHAGFLKAFKAVAGRAPTEWLRQTRLQVTEK